MHGWGWYGIWPFGFGIISFMFGLIFMIVFGVIIYFLFKNIFNPNSNKNHSKGDEYEMIRILNEKLAKGEISEEEYLRKKEFILKK
ncbi:putative membrane protein [Thermosipho atlanticus DSM 15807]|uniref:Putative membrane protein n=2 Tax=Thermosipho TaxID=2420 RepID=A0A1M5QV69_9BACT|nr:putative membrane protein [Thermosipho atlanticus DSM 15807]